METNIHVAERASECLFLAEAVEELYSRLCRAIFIRGDGNIRNNDSGSPLY